MGGTCVVCQGRSFQPLGDFGLSSHTRWSRHTTADHAIQEVISVGCKSVVSLPINDAGALRSAVPSNQSLLTAILSEIVQLPCQASLPYIVIRRVGFAWAGFIYLQHRSRIRSSQQQPSDAERKHMAWLQQLPYAREMMPCPLQPVSLLKDSSRIVRVYSPKGFLNLIKDLPGGCATAQQPRADMSRFGPDQSTDCMDQSSPSARYIAVGNHPLTQHCRPF